MECPAALLQISDHRRVEHVLVSCHLKGGVPGCVRGGEMCPVALFRGPAGVSAAVHIVM